MRGYITNYTNDFTNVTNRSIVFWSFVLFVHS
jgi:hypothetical protein